MHKSAFDIINAVHCFDGKDQLISYYTFLFVFLIQFLQKNIQALKTTSAKIHIFKEFV